MTVKMEDVKKVREITGAGMSSCKDALVKTEGNVDEAIKLLQKEGLAASNARINKRTSEGRIFSHQNGNVVTMYAVKCETDFVANSEDFKNIEMYRNNGETLEAVLDKLKVSMRENIQLGESIDITYDEGDIVSTYIHSDGKSGAVTIIKGYDSAKIKEAIQFAFDTCLHMVAFTPLYISTEDVSVATINEKREIFTAQMNNDPKMANKPDKVKEGILEGQIKKALSELCLMDQPFVKDDKHSVAEVLKRECGPDAKIVAAKLITL
jgi:elongation factor Ts